MKMVVAAARWKKGGSEERRRERYIAVHVSRRKKVGTEPVSPVVSILSSFLCSWRSERVGEERT